ncbi:hypothetical protein [Streptomyces roseochromogenus]|nr:hypothetical protein [Streptomyces roseochromogenus]
MKTLRQQVPGCTHCCRPDTELGLPG